MSTYPRKTLVMWFRRTPGYFARITRGPVTSAQERPEEVGPGSMPMPYLSGCGAGPQAPLGKNLKSGLVEGRAAGPSLPSRPEHQPYGGQRNARTIGNFARAQGRVVGLEIRPITLRASRAFIAEHHRHNKPPRGHKFSVSVWDGEKLVGVATAGRPVARHFDNGITLEVNRTCTDGAPNANSMLYGAVWRAAKAMGYRRAITYTQAEETGASLRAVGWVRVRDLAARGSWAESSVKLADKRDPVGNGGVERVLWEIVCQ